MSLSSLLGIKAIKDTNTSAQSTGNGVLLDPSLASSCYLHCFFLITKPVTRHTTWTLLTWNNDSSFMFFVACVAGRTRGGKGRREAHANSRTSRARFFPFSLPFDACHAGYNTGNPGPSLCWFSHFNLFLWCDRTLESYVLLYSHFIVGGYRAKRANLLPHSYSFLVSPGKEESTFKLPTIWSYRQRTHLNFTIFPNLLPILIVFTR